MRLPGIALEDEAGDARDLAELAAAELGGVEAREDVALDVRRGQQRPEFAPARAAPASGESSPKP